MEPFTLATMHAHSRLHAAENVRMLSNVTFHSRRILDTHFRSANQKVEFRNDVNDVIGV